MQPSDSGNFGGGQSQFKNSESVKRLLTKTKAIPPSIRDSPCSKPLLSASDPYFGGKLLHSNSAPDFSVGTHNIKKRYESNRSGALKLKPVSTSREPLRKFPGQLRKTRLQLEREAAAAEAEASRIAAPPAAPSTGVNTDDPNFLHMDQSSLPLFLFDNPAFEVRAVCAANHFHTNPPHRTPHRPLHPLHCTATFTATATALALHRNRNCTTETPYADQDTRGVD